MKIKSEITRVRVYSINGWKRYAIVREYDHYVVMTELTTFTTLKDALYVVRSEAAIRWGTK